VVTRLRVSQAIPLKVDNKAIPLKVYNRAIPHKADNRAISHKADNKVIPLKVDSNMVALRQRLPVPSKFRHTNKICFGRFRRKDCRHSINPTALCSIR
jgi:hypothetical protein